MYGDMNQISMSSRYAEYDQTHNWDSRFHIKAVVSLKKTRIKTLRSRGRRLTVILLTRKNETSGMDSFAGTFIDNIKCYQQLIRCQHQHQRQIVKVDDAYACLVHTYMYLWVHPAKPQAPQAETQETGNRMTLVY